MDTVSRQRFNAFTLVELMIVVAIIGVLAAVAIPAFIKNSRKAKTTEAVQSVKRIYEGARSYYLQEPVARADITPILKTFPDSTSSDEACCQYAGGKCPGWDPFFDDLNPVWHDLKFSLPDPHYYSRHWFVSGGADESAVFTARVEGDLDCDDTFSKFEMVGSVQSDGTITGSAGIYVENELE